MFAHELTVQKYYISCSCNMCTYDLSDMYASKLLGLQSSGLENMYRVLWTSCNLNFTRMHVTEHCNGILNGDTKVFCWVKVLVTVQVLSTSQLSQNPVITNKVTVIIAMMC